MDSTDVCKLLRFSHTWTPLRGPNGRHASNQGKPTSTRRRRGPRGIQWLGPQDHKQQTRHAQQGPLQVQEACLGVCGGQGEAKCGPGMAHSLYEHRHAASGAHGMFMQCIGACIVNLRKPVMPLGIATGTTHLNRTEQCGMPWWDHQRQAPLEAIEGEVSHMGPWR